MVHIFFKSISSVEMKNNKQMQLMIRRLNSLRDNIQVKIITNIKDQHARPEAFRLGWEVQQQNGKKDQLVTGKVGSSGKEEPLYDDGYGQQQYYQNQNQNQQIIDAAKVIKKKDQNSNIFNAEPNVQGDYKGKGYGDFYNMDKKQQKKDEEDDKNHKGYGHFYTKNEQGAFDNVPKPAQSMKQQQMYK